MLWGVIVSVMLKKTVILTILSMAVVLQACSNSTSFMPASGPSSAELMSTNERNPNIRIIDVNAQNYLFYSQPVLDSTSQQFTPLVKPSLRLGAGDSVQISIWEAPPAVLFGVMSTEGLGVSGGSLNMPEQMISDQGRLTVPFVGRIQASGRTLDQIQQTIQQGLSKIANQPQVIARLSQNNSNTITLIADRKSTIIPLTAKGERLLDIVPNVADLKLLKSTSFLLERGHERLRIRANEISRSTWTNVYLYPGDVVRVMQDQYEVTVLGATNSNTVLNYGDNGLSISEVLAKTYGLNDFRANAKGVYVFRNHLEPIMSQNFEQKVSDVLRFDLTSAEGLLLAQKFQLKNKDMLYVSNSGGSELQKFLSIIGSVISPVSATTSMTK